MQTPNRKEIMYGVNLTCVPAYKFKTGCLSLTLMTPLDKKTAALNAVLPSVLRRGTAFHPDMHSLAAELDGLYGARISPTVRKKGEVQCVGFYSEFIDDEFILGEEKILESVAGLIGEILLNPVTSGGRLKAEYVNGERENLIDDIKALINDKRSYAANRLAEIMCRGEKYGVCEIGTLTDAAKISVATLTKHYRQVIAESPIEIIYCGAASPERVARALCEALATLPRSAEIVEVPETVCLAEPKSAKPKYYREHLDVTQGKLVIGFRMGKKKEAPDNAQLMVLNALFGGTPTSKLFLNVRERLSLCYYASSSIDMFKRVMFVSSGIDFANYDQALEEIMFQFNAVKNGNFDEKELTSAKRAVTTALYAAMDRLGSVESLYLNRTINGMIYTPMELAALADEVTKEEIIDAARNIKLDTVYFLAGEDKTDGT